MFAAFGDEVSVPHLRQTSPVQLVTDPFQVDRFGLHESCSSISYGFSRMNSYQGLAALAVTQTEEQGCHWNFGAQGHKRGTKLVLGGGEFFVWFG